MGKKKKLKYGFHYTWKDILPKSKILTVKAESLDEARELVRPKAKALSPKTQPGCHWITMPQDYDRLIVQPRRKARLKLLRKSSKVILTIVLVGILIALLTSCNTDRFIQCSKNFRKKITQYEQKLTGAKYYKLQPTIPQEDTDK